jgi:hypothetical protein
MRYAKSRSGPTSSDTFALNGTGVTSPLATSTRWIPPSNVATTSRLSGVNA